MLVAHAFVLHWFGQPWIAADGTIKLWEGAVLSVGNSQHIADWYTFSHVIHGFLFYALLWALFPRLPWTTRLIIALGIEIGWEMIENSPIVINAYRENALAIGYSGDSILNSISDCGAMVIGFLAARRFPILMIVGAAVGAELFTLYMIRDGLLLNILFFIHQFQFIQTWQAGYLGL